MALCRSVSQSRHARTHALTHTHTPTHLFNGPFAGLPGWTGTRKVKPIWILLKQETVSGSGISWAISKSAPRSRQITTPVPHRSVFLQAGCPSCHPTNSVKTLKGFKALKDQSTEGIQSTISLASAEKSLKFSVFGPWWGLLYHSKLRRHSGRFCFVYICESLISFDTLVSDQSLASLHVFTY